MNWNYWYEIVKKKNNIKTSYTYYILKYNLQKNAIYLIFYKLRLIILIKKIFSKLKVHFL